MDYFTDRLEVHTIPNQEPSTAADAPVSNVFCRFGVLRELHSNHGKNFESRFREEILEHLGRSTARTSPLQQH
jgi:hypothetical protein